MDRIFKIGLLSLEWQWGLLALIIIPIFFKNNIMKKTKIRSIKTFEQLSLYSAKATHTWLLRSEIVVKQIFNLDHRFYTLQKYVVCKSRIEIGHTFQEISRILQIFSKYKCYIILFTFSSKNTFSPTLLLKACVF